ncbi:Eco57I restriction-modification methylase domain-containing protein [Abyssicoccus albus]|uniref:site-specific DNA-methyltransferase (adenine-specific) n=1 Tax=Abyssicoccus albus TaxID=1817405 RepID=A0A3N5CDG4_9BACL|nr:DNA methyltransferase [Abyssicoccus albus]RPF58212.1 Eco57I restriction-modification methylase [Abyssicoccus albus]
MNKNKIKKLIDKFSDLSTEQIRNINEQTLRQEYLDIFLKELGWDVTNSDNLPYSERSVIIEEFVSEAERPDYSLRKYGQSKFFLEAKRPKIDILTHQNSILQAKKYAWNANHKIVVLSNFENLVIYQTFMMPDENEDNLNRKFRYKHYHYKDYVTKFDEIYKLLSRESVETGYFDEWTDKITPDSATKDNLDNVFLEKINNWRLLLANDLYESKEKQYENKEILNIAVQKLLNQIVFLRFAEDNQLEESQILYRLLNEEIKTKNFLKHLDRKYNAEIFNDKTIQFIKTSTLDDIVQELYYPQSSFDFSIIPLEILSKMYEMYLQTEIEVINGNVTLEPTKDIKIKSVVSTPEEIVKYMVKESLADKLKNKNLNEIFNMKILDIATGSGTFLIEAYNIIESYLIDYYSRTLKRPASPLIVPYQSKLRIIKEMLYGLDINILATQLTRFSLLLRVLRHESRQKHEPYPILPNLKSNILHGNSLVSLNDLDISELSVEKIKDIAPKYEELPESFDVILGNPPYLKTEHIKNATTKEEIQVYKNKYISYYRQYDKYFLFIEKALNYLMKSNMETTTTLIVPNKFINSNSGLKLREYIQKNKALKKIINFKYTQLFENVTIYVCILTLEIGKDAFQYMEVKELEDIHLKTPTIYETKLLTKEGWFLVDDINKRDLYEFAIRNFPKITDEIIVSNGIQTSKNAVYIIDESEIVSEDDTTICFKKNNREYEIEKGILNKYYKKTSNQSIGKSYQKLESKSYVIFPYDKGITYNIDFMQNQFPLAWKYLNDHKKELSSRKMSGGEPSHWYRFGRSQHLKELNQDKLIVGVMSKEPNFNIDRQNYLISSGGTAGYIAIMPKENSLYSIEYLQAWFSHSFTDMIFKVIGSNFEGEYYTHGTYLYDAIPLLPINFESSEEKRYYHLINRYVRDIEKINHLIEGEVVESNIVIFNKKKSVLINKINKIIDALLEKKVVESK